MKNRYLEKLAYIPFKSVRTNAIGGAAIGSALGGASGWGLSSGDNITYDKNQKKIIHTPASLKEKLTGAATGAAVGGILGLGIGVRRANSHNDFARTSSKWQQQDEAWNKYKQDREQHWRKQKEEHDRFWEQKKESWKQKSEYGKQQQDDPFDEFFKSHFGRGRSSGNYGGNSGSRYSRGFSGGIDNIKKDLEFPSHIKTKKEATTHFRRMAAKHHPDRGGSNEKMQAINKAWDDFKNHPEGFEKLASTNNVILDRALKLI